MCREVLCAGVTEVNETNMISALGELAFSGRRQEGEGQQVRRPAGVGAVATHPIHF